MFHVEAIKKAGYPLIPILFWNDNDHVGCVPRTRDGGAWDAPLYYPLAVNSMGLFSSKPGSNS